jgi:hypothetical protein
MSPHFGQTKIEKRKDERGGRPLIEVGSNATGHLRVEGMTRDSRLRLDVVDDEIIITLPFTAYTVTYYKPANSPQLLAKNFPIEDNHRVPLTQAEFLARAWKLANDKARELGWIV